MLNKLRILFATSIYRAIGIVVIILILNFIASWIFVKKNDGKGYINKYIDLSKEIKIKINDEDFQGKFTHESYLKQILIFKGIYGNSQDEIILDDLSHRYFKIMRFEKYGEKFSLAQTSLIKNQELYAKVDPLQFNDAKFGTKENPILIFYYRPVNKQLTVDIRTDEIGKDGFYINKAIPVSPTEEEYRYNVEQYLTYVMSKKGFEERFKL